MIKRHVINVDGRRIHLRTCGSGPPLLLVHQSPRSSAEYEPLLERWADRFTCIAPDTPGFGQSDPLPIDDPSIDDFAEALVALLDVLELHRTAAFGFHSGSVILVAAARRHPERFAALALGGYGLWSPAELGEMIARMLPPFQPQAYGEHLAWLWHRVLEQTWFFPWYAQRDGARLVQAHADVHEIDAIVREMLDAGDQYRIGYGAVLAAPRDLTPFHDLPLPVLLLASQHDPLFQHLDRLDALPPSWQAEAVWDADELCDLAMAHLCRHACAGKPSYPLGDEGFVAVDAGGFTGRIHWRGDCSASTVHLHAPGRSLDLIDAPFAVDLPGHGRSDPWVDAPHDDLGAWAVVVITAVKAIAGRVPALVVGEGASALLALRIGALTGASVAAVRADIPYPDAADDHIAALPDLSPDRFGAYLLQAWGVARAQTFFWPWFDVSGANAVPIDDDATAPGALARVHRALLQASGARPLLSAALTADRDRLLAEAPKVDGWHVSDWAWDRVADVWIPNDDEGGEQ